MREDAGDVTVCAMLNNELEDLQENIDITVLFALIRESTPGEIVTKMGNITNDSRQLCFNYTVPSNDIFEDNSILNVTVISDQPRVVIVNDMIQISIQDDDGILCTYNTYNRVSYCMYLTYIGDKACSESGLA